MKKYSGKAPTLLYKAQNLGSKFLHAGTASDSSVRQHSLSMCQNLFTPRAEPRPCTPCVQRNRRIQRHATLLGLTYGPVVYLRKVARCFVHCLGVWTNHVLWLVVSALQRPTLHVEVIQRVLFVLALNDIISNVPLTHIVVKLKYTCI